MAPVLLMQFVYKSIWLLAIYLPMRSDAGSGLLPVMAAGVLVDLLVIPWPYTFAAFVKGRANSWSLGSRAA
jgi:hypothetical protein